MSATHVTLEQPIHLSKPDGTDLLADAGGYHVEFAGDQQLRLIPDQSNSSPLIMAALKTESDVDVPFPVAQVVLGEEDADIRHVILVLPGKTAWDAVGSLSGIRSRGSTVAVTLSGAQVQRAVATKIAAKERVSDPMGLRFPSLDTPPPQGWVRRPYLAQDIGANYNGEVWIIGIGDVGAGNFNIWHWNKNKSDWDPIDGGGVRIAVDPSGLPWVVNAQGQVWQRTKTGWIQHPGQLAKDIGIGADGSVWIIGTNPVGTAGDFGVWRWNGSGWGPIDGGAVRITVDPSGFPWVVNSKGEISRRGITGWQKQPGLAKDIAVGGSFGPFPWIIGANPVGGGDFGIWCMGIGCTSGATPTDWTPVNGGGLQITVGQFSYTPWVVNSKGQIFTRCQVGLTC
jgi:hypothetical protein